LWYRGEEEVAVVEEKRFVEEDYYCSRKKLWHPRLLRVSPPSLWNVNAAQEAID
jgi:hypothetical protein